LAALRRLGLCYNVRMETVYSEERMGPSGFIPLLVASLAFHFVLLLLAAQYIRFEGNPLPSSDTIVQLVEPVPPSSSSSPAVLFGTQNPDDLNRVPKGKETHLPPIPRSESPGPGLSKSISPPPHLSPPPSQSAPSPKPDAPPKAGGPPVSPPPMQGSPTEAPKSELAEPAAPSSPSGVGPTSPSTPSERIPQLGQEGNGVLAPGSPGLPFARPEELQRLAKLFTDQEAAKTKKNDPITLNTRDLKFYSYGLQVLNKIETVWKYPEEAGRAGIGGEVVVDLMVRRDGSLDDLLLIQSSGYSMLDDEVFRAIHAASPYGRLPTGLVEDPFPMTIHFIYVNHNFFAFRSR